MHHSTVIFLIFLFVLPIDGYSVGYGNILIATGLIVSSPTNTTTLQVFLQGYTPELNFTIFPCFGQLNWFLGGGFLPNVTNTTDNNCNFYWEGTGIASSYCVLNYPANDTTTYIVAQAPKAFGTPSSKFDMLVFSRLEDFDRVYPYPGASGALAGAYVDTEHTAVKLTWEGTGNPNDTYSVYYFNGSVSDSSGHLTAGGCGVLDFMTDSQATITSNGNVYSTKLSSIKGKVITVSVLVKRLGGYLSAYNQLTVGGGIELIPCMLLLGILLFISIFFVNDL